MVGLDIDELEYFAEGKNLMMVVHHKDGQGNVSVFNLVG
jgi:hypothetical protein